MRLGLFPKPNQKSKPSLEEEVSGQGLSPVYLIGFLIIMFFALILHFVPQKQQTDENFVEPVVEIIPDQAS